MNSSWHENMSLGGKSLHYTLRIIAGLVILSPLAITYLVLESRAFTGHPEYIYILFFALVINMAALVIIGRIFGKFLMLSSQVKKAEAGDIPVVEIEEEVSELKDISDSFNHMMQKFTGTTEELRHRVFELFALRELVEIASKSLDMDGLLTTLLEKAMTTFDAGAGAVFLLEAEKQMFRAIESRGPYPGIRAGSYLGMDDPLVHEVTKSRKPLLTHDFQASAKESKRITPKAGDVSLMIMPLLCGSEIIGVLSIARTQGDKPFTEEDLTMLSIMIEQVGFALENARLHASVRDHSRKLELQTKELKRYQDHLEDLVRERTQELEATQEELIRKTKLATLGQLTGTVSHELRNPLGTIRNSLDTLASKIRGSGLNVDNILERMDRNINRCDNIIRELLDYSRTQPLERKATDADAWLNQLLREHPIPEGIQLHTSLHSGVNLELDQERVRQAIINVIDNACQALLSEESRQNGISQKVKPLLRAQPKSVTVRPPGLSVESLQSGNRLLISITDNGPGISPETLSRIFEPLFSTKTYGIGLGLCLVKQIMEQHDGGVDIESRPGDGTKVTLWLPLTTEHHGKSRRK